MQDEQPDFSKILEALNGAGVRFVVIGGLAMVARAVDLLGEIAGADSFEELWERASAVELFGVSVRVASIDDLILMKKAANRLKDQNHILELEALRKLKQAEGL